MVSRETTRAVLAALAAGTTLHEALELGAGFERRKKSVNALRATAAKARARQAQPGDLRELRFDPPVIGEILAGAVRAQESTASLREAADLAIEAMQSPMRGHRLTNVMLLLSGSAAALGIAQILRQFVAPVFAKMNPAFLEPANFRADAASFLALISFIAAFAALVARMRDSAFKLNLLSSVAPWGVFLVPSMYVRYAKERGIDRGAEFLFAAAGSATGVRIQLPKHRGPAHLDGDRPARSLARLGRLARLEAPRVDAGKVLELISMLLLVLAVYAGTSYYSLITKIAEVIQ